VSVHNFINRIFSLKGDEAVALFYSFAYFFTLLCGYYIIRPLRDEMGVAGGVDNLQWLFSGTFLVMIAAMRDTPKNGQGVHAAFLSKVAGDT